jgi:hypothetical protein
MQSKLLVSQRVNLAHWSASNRFDKFFHGIVNFICEQKVCLFFKLRISV